MKKLFIGAALLVFAQTAAAQPPPIIDMHLHALQADSFGPPGGTICAPFTHWAVRDPKQSIEGYRDILRARQNCHRPLKAPDTDDEIRNQSIAELERLNIVAVTSGDPDIVERWREQAPERIIPGLLFGVGPLPSIADLRQLHAEGRLKVMGELASQYSGLSPNDPKLEPYFALAEELDIPVGIHVGPGPAGVAYSSSPDYRASDSNALLLEDVLIRHPKLRLYVMHAGWPLADQMIALMYAHPQIYVDTGIIDFAYPRADFHTYLKRLVDAGFGKRIMFGSDQMIWPQAIKIAIEGIESADFLTPEQKRDILYNNAVRFLRLEEK